MFQASSKRIFHLGESCPEGRGARSFPIGSRIRGGARFVRTRYILNIHCVHGITFLRSLRRSSSKGVTGSFVRRTYSYYVLRDDVHGGVGRSGVAARCGGRRLRCDVCPFEQLRCGGVRGGAAGALQLRLRLLRLRRGGAAPRSGLRGPRGARGVLLQRRSCCVRRRSRGETWRGLVR